MGFGILRFENFDGVFVAARVFEVAVDLGGGAGDGGFELVEGAGEDGEFWSVECRVASEQ